MAPWQPIRDSLPWPFGTHWCWHETVTYGVFALVLVVDGAAVLVAGRPHLIAIPAGAVMLGIGWVVGAAVRRHYPAPPEST